MSCCLAASHVCPTTLGTATGSGPFESVSTTVSPGRIGSFVQSAVTTTSTRHLVVEHRIVVADLEAGGGEPRDGFAGRKPFDRRNRSD